MEKMPMASVDDPGEYLLPPGEDKQVELQILKKVVSFDGRFSKNQQCFYDQFQMGGVSGVESEAIEKGSLASDPTKDSNPSGGYLKVKSFYQN